MSGPASRPGPARPGPADHHHRPERRERGSGQWQPPPTGPTPRAVARSWKRAFGGGACAASAFSGCACGRPHRGVPEEVLADPLFADVEDRADLLEGAAEISELMSGAFAADPRSLPGEGSRASSSASSRSAAVRWTCSVFRCASAAAAAARAGALVAVVEPAATCGRDAPDDGGPAASFTLAACSFYVAGLLVLAESPVVGG